MLHVPFLMFFSCIYATPLWSIPVQSAIHGIYAPAVSYTFSSLPLLDVMTHSMSTTATPPAWLTLPFITLLLMIAAGPLLFPNFWHKHYAKVAIFLALFVVIYYCAILNNSVKPVEAAAEYLQFIALVTALYVATGGILVDVHTRATSLTNVIFLTLGAIMANFIGTTGASMLLIRPYIRLNKQRICVYHIVFFIFIVSNIGGALTPIGDPPLFLGFLKGVPFTWSLTYNIFAWFIAIVVLLSIFYFIDRRNKEVIDPTGRTDQQLLSIRGKGNLIWLAIIIGAVFVDPTIVDWVPAIHHKGHTISFVRELILFMVALLAYVKADKSILQLNRFNFEPLKEVCFIFIGIFGTMMPALEFMRLFAQSTWGQALMVPTPLYWCTGLFSSILDNAPTYLNFVAASMAAKGADISLVEHVRAYAEGGVYTQSVRCLQAISLAAVFFGAMTYIGNGPNFMVRSIAEEAGIRMPSFGKYIWQFSIPYLLPVLLLVWLLCFA